LAACFCQFNVFTKKTACRGLVTAVRKASLKKIFRVLFSILLKSMLSMLELVIALSFGVKLALDARLNMFWHGFAIENVGVRFFLFWLIPSRSVQAPAQCTS